MALSANPKAVAKRQRHAADPEKHRANVRRWREANPEKWRELQVRSQRVKAWASNLASHCRARSKARGWPTSDITGDYLLGLYEQQGGRCYWLGVPMVPSMATRDPRRPSVDRLVPALGYVQGNVVLATAFANLGRSVLAADKFAAFIAELKDQMRMP